jgi:hypothetical protein
MAVSHATPWLYGAQLLVGLACSVLGGYVAAWLAKHDELLNRTLSAFLRRPPLLPHCESLFLYLWVVAFPPFLPMHRGQIILVRGCSGQYFSLATAYFYLKTPLQSHPLAFFFLCRPACPSPTSTLCT